MYQPKVASGQDRRRVDPRQAEAEARRRDREQREQREQARQDVRQQQQVLANRLRDTPARRKAVKERLCVIVAKLNKLKGKRKENTFRIVHLGRQLTDQFGTLPMANTPRSIRAVNRLFERNQKNHQKLIDECEAKVKKQSVKMASLSKEFRQLTVSYWETKLNFKLPPLEQID